MTAGANDNLVAAALALLRPLAANVGTVGNWRDHWRALRPDCWESPRMQGLLQTRDKLPKPACASSILAGGIWRFVARKCSSQLTLSFSRGPVGAERRVPP
jgi:hypothetical protein